MKEFKQLINAKEQYESPKLDVILFAYADVLTVSGDEDEGEWDPLV